MIDLGNWPNAESITAYSTLILAVVTGLLLFFTWKYLGEIRRQASIMRDQGDAMKRQADAMDEQSSFVRDQADAMTRQAKTMEGQFDIIREESATMKRQADTMEGQSSLIRDQSTIMLDQASAMKRQADIMEKQSNVMLENIRYDLIINKYERANKELSLLVGALYARRKDPSIFSLKKRGERVQLKISPRFCGINESQLDFVSFWDSIDQNLYLNRSDYLNDNIKNYNELIDEYFAQSGLNSEASDRLSQKFNDEIKPQLIASIEKRYAEISAEISSIVLELEAQEDRIN